MIKLLSGTFAEGCGVVAYNENTDDFYHCLVLKEKETNRLFIAIKGKKYFEDDVIR